jgi:hypothetical protein
MKNEALRTGDLKLFGQYLHAFQDSYSHQNANVPKTVWREIYDTFVPLPNNSPYASDVGHLLDGEWPDKTYNRPNLADEMAKQSYVEIQKFLNQTSKKPLNDWSSISNKVQQFNRIKIENENEKGQTLFR